MFAVAILLSNASSIIVPRERIHLSGVLALEQVGGVEIVLVLQAEGARGVDGRLDVLALRERLRTKSEPSIEIEAE